MPLDNTIVAPKGNYPNIVPDNNLRLPDALTIKHGPARLLSRFVLEGDKEARRRGVHLRLRHDFDELLFFNQQQTAAGKWVSVAGAFNPNCVDLHPENAFWLSGENEEGEIVFTWAARIHNWVGTNLAERIREAWYGRDLGQPYVLTAEAANLIGGICVCGGAAWVRPDYRGKHLSHLIPRIGKAYACARWPIDWSFCFISRRNVDKGLADSFGQRNLSYSILYLDSPWGEAVIAYTPINEVYADFANFLTSELLETETPDIGATSADATFEHMVRKTSLEPVFHGSNSLS